MSDSSMNGPLLAGDYYGYHPEIEGTEDFLHVAHHWSGEYEWEEMNVWYSPSQRRYFWYADSGCSCYDYELPETLGDFMNGGQKDARRAAERFIHEATFVGGSDEYQSIQDMLSQINNFREDKA